MFRTGVETLVKPGLPPVQGEYSSHLQLNFNCFIKEVFEFIELALFFVILAVRVAGLERKRDIRHVPGASPAGVFDQSMYCVAGHLILGKRFVDQAPEITSIRLQGGFNAP